MSEELTSENLEEIFQKKVEKNVPTYNVMKIYFPAFDAIEQIVSLFKEQQIPYYMEFIRNLGSHRFPDYSQNHVLVYILEENYYDIIKNLEELSLPLDFIEIYYKDEWQ